MSIILVAGQTKRLDVSLTPGISPPGISPIVIWYLVITPARPILGDTVYISCQATNPDPSGIPSTKHVELKINGVTDASWDITLKYPDPPATLSHSFIPETVGIYTVEFNGLFGSFEVTEILPPNLYTEEPWSVLFNAAAFYQSVADHPDPDFALGNRRLAACDVAIAESLIRVPDSATYTYWLRGTYKMGAEIPYDPLDGFVAVMHIFEEGVYATATVGMPYPSIRTAVGIEDWYVKFLQDCCIEYLPETDWNQWKNVVDYYKAPLVKQYALPGTSGEYLVAGDAHFQHLEPLWWYKIWRSKPLPPANYVVVLEIGVEFYEDGVWWTYPLYVWRIGRIMI